MTTMTLKQIRDFIYETPFPFRIKLDPEPENKPDFTLRIFLPPEIRPFFTDHQIVDIASFRIDSYLVYIPLKRYWEIKRHLTSYWSGYKKIKGWIWKAIRGLGVVVKPGNIHDFWYMNHRSK